MKSVSGLMEHGLDVAMHPNRVHKNEWQARLGKGGLVPSGRFALAIRQIEQAQVAHRPEAVPEPAVQPIKDLLRLHQHFLHFLERAQGRAIQRIDCQVPRPQFRQV